eukprot:3408329-Amphidinium_carterae.1
MLQNQALLSRQTWRLLVLSLIIREWRSSACYWMPRYHLCPKCHAFGTNVAFWGRSLVLVAVHHTRHRYLIKVSLQGRRLCLQQLGLPRARQHGNS